MGPLELYLLAWMGYLRGRIRVSRGEEGYTTQAVILTAVFAALALAVGVIITAKVLAKANSVDLNSGAGG